MSDDGTSGILRAHLPSVGEIVSTAIKVAGSLHPSFKELFLHSALRVLTGECSEACERDPVFSTNLGNGNVTSAEDASQALLDYLWERLNSGHWADVPIDLRTCYSLSSLVKAVVCLRKKAKLDALKACDMGLMMGAPLKGPLGNPLGTVADALCADLTSGLSFPDVPVVPKGGAADLAAFDTRGLPVGEVPRLMTPSVEKFVREFVEAEKPVLIEGAVDHWPALKWTVSELRKIAAFRTVPVELGSKYTDADWTQSLMTFDEFVSEHVAPSGDGRGPKAVGYLAQYDLFSHVPRLKKGFSIPDYCLSDHDDVDVNAWFGPEGTVSPLHTDPRGNCLVQVFGWKYVRLYGKDQTPFLYPHDEGLLSNTSRITDAERPDLVEFPDFELAEGAHCVLGPGELLYIPPGCWHYVRSLSVSLSISFWWDF